MSSVVSDQDKHIYVVYQTLPMQGLVSTIACLFDIADAIKLVESKIGLITSKSHTSDESVYEGESGEKYYIVRTKLDPKVIQVLLAK